MDSELEEYTGYCNTLMSISIQPKVGITQMFWLVAWVVIGLFPIWAFLTLDTPHDCYRCIGKDPDRIYSIYQLTKCEIIERNMKTKFGRSIDMGFAANESVIELQMSLFETSQRASIK